MSSEQILKKSVLGGFKKEGVLNYVEQLQNEILGLKKEISNSSSCRDELEKLKGESKAADKELDALKEENEILAEKNEALAAENAALAVKLEEAQASIADYENKQLLFEERIASIEKKFAEIESSYSKYGEAKSVAAAVSTQAGQAVVAAKAEISDANERIKTACVNFDSSTAALKASIDNLMNVLSAVSEQINAVGGEEE